MFVDVCVRTCAYSYRFSIFLFISFYQPSFFRTFKKKTFLLSIWINQSIIHKIKLNTISHFNTFECICMEREKRKHTQTHTIKSKHIKLRLEQQKKEAQSIVFSQFYSWIECEWLWNIYHNTKLYNIVYISEWIYSSISIWNRSKELYLIKKWLEMNDEELRVHFSIIYPHIFV